MNLVDIYRTSHPKIAECTFFSMAHIAFSWIDHVIKSQIKLWQAKTTTTTKSEIVSSIFFPQNTIKLVINIGRQLKKQIKEHGS